MCGVSLDEPKNVPRKLDGSVAEGDSSECPRPCAGPAGVTAALPSFFLPTFVGALGSLTPVCCLHCLSHRVMFPCGVTAPRKEVATSHSALSCWVLPLENLEHSELSDPIALVTAL